MALAWLAQVNFFGTSFAENKIKTMRYYAMVLRKVCDSLEIAEFAPLPVAGEVSLIALFVVRNREGFSRKYES